jgi:hypothetical protein
MALVSPGAERFTRPFPDSHPQSRLKQRRYPDGVVRRVFFPSPQQNRKTENTGNSMQAPQRGTAWTGDIHPHSAPEIPTTGTTRYTHRSQKIPCRIKGFRQSSSHEACRISLPATILINTFVAETKTGPATMPLFDSPQILRSVRIAWIPPVLHRFSGSMPSLLTTFRCSALPDS